MFHQLWPILLPYVARPPDQAYHYPPRIVPKIVLRLLYKRIRDHVSSRISIAKGLIHLTQACRFFPYHVLRRVGRADYLAAIVKRLAGSSACELRMML